MAIERKEEWRGQDVKKKMSAWISRDLKLVAVEIRRVGDAIDSWTSICCR